MYHLILELLESFLQIGLFSIGGGYATIPLIQEQIVSRRGWLTLQEFTDIITISQMTPGPLAVNTSTFVGIRVAGLQGAVTATFGCVISGFLISLLLYRFFQKHHDNMYALRVLNGLKAVSAGLIAASALTILLIAFKQSNSSVLSLSNLNYWAVGLFAISLFVLRKFKLNPLLIIALSGVVGYFIYR